MNPVDVLALQNKGYVELKYGWIAATCERIDREAIIHAGWKYVLDHIKVGKAQLRYNLAEGGEEEIDFRVKPDNNPANPPSTTETKVKEREGKEQRVEKREQGKSQNVEGAEVVLPEWLKWVDDSYRSVCATGLVGTRTAKSIRDADAKEQRSGDAEMDEENDQNTDAIWKEVGSSQSRRKRKRKTQIEEEDGSEEEEEEEDDDDEFDADREDREWFAQDDEDLKPRVLRLDKCHIYFKSDENGCCRFRAFKRRDQNSGIAANRLQSREITDIVWKVLERPNDDGIINSKVMRCMDAIQIEKINMECHLTASQFLARPTMALEEQKEPFKVENSPGFDAFSQGINRMGDGTQTGDAFSSSKAALGQKDVTNFDRIIEESNSLWEAKFARAQMGDPTGGQTLLPQGRKLVQQKDPKAPANHMEMIAQRKQRVWEEFGIPPGLQQQLNPFEGRAAAQDAGGIKSGGGGGGGQRTIGGLTPTAEAWNITLQNERNWLMEYANEIIDRATSPHRVRAAAMHKRIPKSDPRAHNPNNWKIRFIINSVSHIRKIDELYHGGELEREYYIQCNSDIFSIPKNAFTEECMLTLKEQNGIQMEQPVRDKEGGDKKKAKAKTKKRK